MSLKKFSLLLAVALIVTISSLSSVYSDDGFHFDAESPTNSSEKLITEEKMVLHDADPQGKEIVMFYVYNAVKNYVLYKIHMKDLTPNGSAVIPSIAEGGIDQNFVNVKFISPNGSGIDFKLVLVSKPSETTED